MEEKLSCFRKNSYPAHGAMFNSKTSNFPPYGNFWYVKSSNDLDHSLEEDDVFWNFNGTGL